MRKSTTMLRIATAAITIGIFAFTACNRNKDSKSSLTDMDDNGGYASDYSKLEKTSNDAQGVADQIGNNNSNTATFRTTNVGCTPTITRDTVSNPHVLTIDFGTVDCIGNDGTNRRGKIIVNYTGHYKDSASNHTITYDGYYVNDNELSGSKSVTNNGMNTAGHYSYTVTVNESLNLGTGNGSVSWTGNRTRTWMEGYSTSEKSDDVYQITGSTSVTRANGNTFTMGITSPLTVALNCDWIKSGILTITGPHGSRTLDYGSGDCDNEAQLTIGNSTYNITLH